MCFADIENYILKIRVLILNKKSFLFTFFWNIFCFLAHMPLNVFRYNWLTMTFFSEGNCQTSVYGKPGNMTKKYTDVFNNWSRKNHYFSLRFGFNADIFKNLLQQIFLRWENSFLEQLELSQAWLLMLASIRRALGPKGGGDIPWAAEILFAYRYRHWWIFEQV